MAMTTIVSVSGEMDFATAPQVEAALDAAMRSAATTVVVDLARLRFIDAAGLGVFVRAHDKLDCSRVDEIVVRNPSPLARHLLAISGIDTLAAEPDRHAHDSHRSDLAEGPTKTTTTGAASAEVVVLDLRERSPRLPPRRRRIAHPLWQGRCRAHHVQR